MKTQKKLVELINSKGIKQSFIADSIGMDRDKLSKSMSLKRKLTVDEFGAICMLLGVSFEFFKD